MSTKIYGEKTENQEYFIREAVYGLVFGAGQKVALIKVPYGYILPGGGIEKDEDHKSCLKREFIEEIGRDIQVVQYTGSLSQYVYSPVKKKYFKLIGYFYLVKMKELCEGKVEEDHELVWRDLRDVNDLMYLEFQAKAIMDGYKLRKGYL